MKTQLGIDFASVDANALGLGTMTAGKRLAALRTAVSKTGMKFAIVRATYGSTMDQAFQRTWASLADAGIVRGAYMFPVMRKGRDPRSQVERFAQAVHKAGGLRIGVDLPPVLDVEFPKGIKATGMTRLECIDWINKAVAALIKTFGCQPMLYTSARVWDGEDDDSLDADRVPVPTLVDCPLWLARYPYKLRIKSHHLPAERDGLIVPPVPKQLGDASDIWIHQYQGDAKGFPGFSSTVDLNRFFLMSRKTAVRGEKVKWVQRKLQAHGRDLGPADCPEKAIDGQWHDATERAVRDFQSLELLTVDGVIGVQTFAALAWL